MSTTQPGRRRRLDASVAPVYERPTRGPRFESRRTARTFEILTGIGWLLGTLGSATSVVAVGAPSWLWRPSAALLLVISAMMLTHRVGGHMRIWVTLTALLAGSALLTDLNLLLVTAAGASAVLAAVNAVMFTLPAASTGASLREYGISLLLTVSGAMGVAAWNAPAQIQIFSGLTLAAAVAVGLAIMSSLGAGLHGLTRQHLWILVGVGVVAVLLFVYGGIVRLYGSPGLKEFLDDSIIWMRQHIGGVPRPFEVLIGFPAIIFGTSLRSRYREGWWVCVFAVLGTAVITTSLIDPGAYPSYFALSTLYSAVLGVPIGLLLRRIFMSQRSARAARAVAPPSRVEPGRFSPLK